MNESVLWDSAIRLIITSTSKKSGVKRTTGSLMVACKGKVREVHKPGSTLAQLLGPKLTFDSPIGAAISRAPAASGAVRLPCGESPSVRPHYTHPDTGVHSLVMRRKYVLWRYDSHNLSVESRGR